MDALADWIRRHGGTVHVEISDERGEGRGVVAARDIEHGARILSVPRALLLTPAVVRESDVGRAVTDASHSVSDDQFLLAAYLLASRRSETPWTVYADALPSQRPDVPTGYDETDLALLEGSPALRRIRHERRMFREQFDVLITAVPALAGCTFEEFFWARTLVPSRAFALLGSEALVPMADMFNHRRAPDVEWGFEHPMDSFVMRALRPITSGERLHDSYGKKCNALLFELYGFCPGDGDRDEATVRFPVIDASHPLAGGTSTFGRTVDGERTFRVSAAAAHAEEATAITYLRRLLGDHAPLEQTDSRVASAIVEACDRALAAYPTTVTEDDALLNNDGLSSRARNCVRVRAGEKRALGAVRARYSHA
ncbi:MAG TPA: SET domain-containing histone-lysine N-methyltransferase [Gemmatimonadaceae bacterium]|jgi:hypothetical protein